MVKIPRFKTKNINSTIVKKAYHCVMVENSNESAPGTEKKRADGKQALKEAASEIRMDRFSFIFAVLF